MLLGFGSFWGRPGYLRRHSGGGGRPVFEAVLAICSWSLCSRLLMALGWGRRSSLSHKLSQCPCILRSLVAGVVNEVVSVSWDPLPREPVEGVLRAMSVLELAAHVWDAKGFGVLSWRRPDSPLSHCLSLRWFRSHVVVSGMRPQLGQAAVLRVLCVSVATLSRPCTRTEAGASLHGGFSLAVLSSPRDGTDMCSFPTWRCAEHCFLFVPDYVGFCGSHVFPAALDARGSSLQELGVGLVAKGAMAPCVVSSSESERCVRLPCMIRARVAGCSCCCAACLASVVAQHVCDVAARLALDSLAVVFLVWRTLASQSWCGAPGRLREVLLEFLSVGSGGSEDCSSLVSAVVVPPQSLRCAVGSAGAFWLGRVLVRFSQDGSWRFWWRFSPKLPCVVRLAMRLAVALASLSRCSAGADVACCALSGLRFLACGFWQASCGESFLLAVVLLWPLVHLGCTLFTFAVCGSTVCSCSSVLVLCRLELWCIVLYPGVELSASRTLCVGLCLVVVPLPLWGGCFALSRWPVVLRALVVACVQSELLAGVSCVVVGNYVLCRVLLATERVANLLVPIARSVGGCSRVVFGWLFPLFGLNLASLGTGGIVVPSWGPFVCLE
ncbi:hypothetical protein Taro_022308 [Colocasia esculenta]|uniref:Uncharacterized protein n=1 Tax=Colocasia esculenta TaxID=4460 RepID=A0A843V1A0_COLES|nr:hypothetical protein [Colocasia esculenta]